MVAEVVHGAIVILQGPCDGVFTFIWDVYQVCATSVSNGMAHIILNLNLVYPPQTRVPGPGYIEIWYSNGGWSGVLPLPYPKAHVMVLLHPSGTYTKYVQLQEAMLGLTSSSTSFIHPKLGSLGLGITKSDISMVAEVYIQLKSLEVD